MDCNLELFSKQTLSSLGCFLVKALCHSSRKKTRSIVHRCFFFTELPLTLRSYIDAPSVQTKKTSVVYCPVKQISLSVNVLFSIPAPSPESHTSFHHHGLPFHGSNCVWLVLAVALAVTKRTGGTLENCPIAYMSL